MKNLIDALNESLQIINEEFNAEILRTTFMDNPKNKKFFKNVLSRELKWNLINEGDSERVDIDIAAKAAYKKIEDTAYILWLDANDTIVARTIGISVIDANIYANYVDKNCPNVRRVAKLSAYAIIVKNYLNFDTNELKKQRIEARRGALAFKSEKEVLEDNLKRYNKILKEIKYNGFDINEYVIKVKDCSQRMTEVLEKLTGDFVPDDWNYFTRNFQYLNNVFEDLVRAMQQLAGAKMRDDDIKNNPEKYKDADWDVAGFAKGEIQERIENFEKVYKKFNVLYMGALEKDDLYKLW